MTDDGHISEHDLERLMLGMVKDEGELERVEEHLLVCAECIDRTDEAREYIQTMRGALRKGAGPKADAGHPRGTPKSGH